MNPLLRRYGPWGSGAHVSYLYGRLVNDRLWHLPDRAQVLISGPDSMRTSLKRSASSWAPRSPHDGAICHSARRCSKRILPNAASAASRCAWRTGCSRSVLYISAGTHRGLDKGTETFGAMRPASSSVRPRTITVREHHGCGSRLPWREARLAICLTISMAQAVRLPVDEEFYPSYEHLRWHHAKVFQGRHLAIGTSHF